MYLREGKSRNEDLQGGTRWESKLMKKQLKSCYHLDDADPSTFAFQLFAFWIFEPLLFFYGGYVPFFIF